LVIESTTVASLPQSPEVVFDFVADPANQPRWNSELTNMELLTEGPSRLGSRMAGDYSPLGRIETEITVFERPSRLVLFSTGGQADMTLDFRFDADGTGTSMTVAGSVALKGALKFMEAAVRGPAAAQFEARAGRIKAALA
jgi:uncharacterized protein YndB with AHSA1/START domain